MNKRKLLEITGGIFMFASALTLMAIFINMYRNYYNGWNPSTLCIENNLVIFFSELLFIVPGALIYATYRVIKNVGEAIKTTVLES